jgi:predicted subunit of tRNA(5-methylaminomethyl-2-thiouridylate) methyltransferase
MPSASEPAVILFSGGRHSSLAACLIADSRAYVDLLTTSNGATVGNNIVVHRVRELRNQFPSIRRHVRRETFGLFRRLAIANIEQDFAVYHRNLIPIGDALASHTEAILYCRREMIPLLVSGAVGYQGHFVQQTAATNAAIRTFVERYGIEYQTPLLRYGSIDDVKYALFEYGISTKSLEGCSLFDDSYSEADAETVMRYIAEKQAICEQHLRRRGVLPA